MKKILALFAILTIIITGCGKKRHTIQLSRGDFLIVGWNGGYAQPGAPLQYYMLQGRQLCQDHTQYVGKVPQDTTDFRFSSLLPHDRYMRVAGLDTLIPAELLANNNAHVGKPLIDAGYTHVFTRRDGQLYRWYFEADQSASSLPVQEFVRRLNSDFR